VWEIDSALDVRRVHRAAGAERLPGGLLRRGAAVHGAGDGGAGGDRPGGESLRAEILQSRLEWKDNANDLRDRLVFRWQRGEETTPEEIGDPLATDAYALCVYDESGAPVLIAEAEVPAGGTCKHKPCWKVSKSGKVFRYRDPETTPDGILSTVLNSGSAGKARAVIVGKGVGLPDVALPLALPVRVQLQREGSGECLEALFDAAGVQKNDATQFKGRATGP
jgi:hypothetical protein